jgi:hypothetical protein
MLDHIEDGIADIEKEIQNSVKLNNNGVVDKE